MLKKVKATIIGSGHLNILAYIQNNEAEARKKPKLLFGEGHITAYIPHHAIPSTIIMNVFHLL